MPQPIGIDPVLIVSISLFMILLTFFILLNSLAVPDEKRRRAAIGSLNENFGVLSGGFSLLDGEGGGDNPLVKPGGLLDFSGLVPNPSDRPRVTGMGNRATVIIPGTLLFEPGSYKVLEAARPVLDRLAKTAVETGCPIEIAGFVARPTEGARELSAFRALALLKYLMEKGTVDPKHMTAYGWGEDRPAVTDKAPEARTVNERMEVSYLGIGAVERPEGTFSFRDFFFKALDPH